MCEICARSVRGLCEVCARFVGSKELLVLVRVLKSLNGLKWDLAFLRT